MYKIPEDIILELEKKYPDYKVKEFCHDLFDSILQKSYQDGSCIIRQFGKFIAFQTYSKKLSRMVPRIKFKLSATLEKKIKKDTYLQKQLPIKVSTEFTKKHEQKCSKPECKLQKQKNIKAISDASNHGKKRTYEKLAINEIIKIVSDDNNE